MAGPAAGLAPAGGYSFPSNFTLFAGPAAGNDERKAVALRKDEFPFHTLNRAFLRVVSQVPGMPELPALPSARL